MTGFIIKIIALVTMFIDHSSILLYTGSFISSQVYLLMRGIGRIAFPVYAFLLLNGFSYSSDRRKYLLRLMFFALISQLPFTLYFSGAVGAEFGKLSFNFFSPLLIIPALISLLIYLKYSQVRKLKELFVLLSFILLPGIHLISGSTVLLDGKMSIFYSLAIGLGLISFIDKLRRKELRLSELLLYSALLLALILLIQPHSDYGLSALILICGLYFLDGRRLFQAFYICLWAFLQYGFSGFSLMYSLFACLSGLLIYFYNGKKGPGLKYLFYAFYPLHLLLLVLIRILL